MIRIATTQDLADTVGLLRHLHGLTQAELAELMGCHQARVGEYERHRRKVSVRVALIHLEALGYQLAVVPIAAKAPETALSASVAAETPPAGVLGCAGGAEAASGASEAVALLRYALHLRQHGEHAPGGTETWHRFDQQAEALIRATDTTEGQP